MENLTKLFKLLQITRSMPQSGYALLGLSKGELSDLAQHQYLVTMTAWQIARGCKRAGAKINIEKILELSLVHDLGELFGSDISMPYAIRNKKAKKFARAFEMENHKFLANWFGEDKKYATELFKEIMDAKTDEGRIAKLADYLETAHYRFYVRMIDKKDLEINMTKLEGVVKKFKDPIVKKYTADFLKLWTKDFFTGYDSNNIMHLLD